MYRIEISSKAKKQLKKLPSEVITSIKEKLLELSEDPRPFGYTKLTGEESYRVRVGNYRIIYDIKDEELIVLVLKAGHRRNIYKG